MCSQAVSYSSSIGFVPDCVGANVDEGLNRFDAAVAVLGNDELKVVSPLFKLLHALDFVFAFRLHAFEVVGGAVKERDGRSVFFNRSAIAQIRQPRAFVLSAFHLSVELAERNHSDIQFFRERRESVRDFRHLTHAVSRITLRRSEQQHVIDENDIQAASIMLVLSRELARTDRDIGDGQTPFHLDRNRQLIEDCLQSAGAEPVVVAQLNSIAPMLELIRQTQLAGIVTETADLERAATERWDLEFVLEGGNDDYLRASPAQGAPPVGTPLTAAPPSAVTGPAPAAASARYGPD